MKKTNAEIIALITASDIYRDYERAFGEATGLPLSLTPVEDWQMAHRGAKHENRFCALMGQSNKTCSECLLAQREIVDPEAQGARTIRCFAGLCETSVPLRIGANLVGFLRTGEVMLKRPTAGGFARLERKFADWNLRVDLARLREAYFETQIHSKTQYESAVRLLEIFARHLALVANQLVIQREMSEPPVISRARSFILEHQTEELPLDRVAKAVHVSTYYFCKIFKKATGLNFTAYLGRLRVENAKNLLLNPNARITEVAFGTGFNSITHFNRTFKELVGQSPTEYRETLPKAA